MSDAEIRIETQRVCIQGLKDAKEIRNRYEASKEKENESHSTIKSYKDDENHSGFEAIEGGNIIGNEEEMNLELSYNVSNMTVKELEQYLDINYASRSGSDEDSMQSVPTENSLDSSNNDENLMKSFMKENS